MQVFFDIFPKLALYFPAKIGGFYLKILFLCQKNVCALAYVIFFHYLCSPKLNKS